VAVPWTDPALAVIVATPSSTAVIVAVLPVPTTVATAGSSDVHVSDGEGTTDWLASFTTAVTVRVSPADVMTASGDSVSPTEATTVFGYAGPALS
jgi:hypothetical protein